MIAAAGTYAEVSPQALSAVVTDHRPHLLMAGFIDTNLHFPQAQVVASWGSQLLDWLNGYVFAEEARFVDPEHSAAKDYLHIYETYGLLSDKMLLGHCIHLSDREVASMAETGAHPVFCPTSNLFLGSGGFNDQRLREAGVANAIATDIGAGTSYSMLQTLNEGYKILQLQDRKLHALRLRLDHAGQCQRAWASRQGRHARWRNGSGYSCARRQGDPGDGTSHGAGRDIG